MVSSSRPPHKTLLPFHGIGNDPSLYLDLDPLSRQIRYVDLHPGSAFDPVICSLGYTSLELAACEQISYEALSYCWGSLDDLESITLLTPHSHNIADVAQQTSHTGDPHRITTTGNFHVTRNLKAALLALRRPYEERRLWIDAICINQSNGRERTHQVGHMNLIYATAEQVVVWLGDADDHSRIFFRCRELLEREYEVYRGQLGRPVKPAVLDKYDLRIDDWERLGNKFCHAMGTDEVILRILGPPNQVNNFPIFMSAGLLFPKVFDNFLSRPWFRRMWVYQEVALAKQKKHGERLVVIHVGQSTMRWIDLLDLFRAFDHLRNANYFFRRRAWKNISWFGQGWYWPVISTYLSSGFTFDMKRYVLHTRDFECSDPRDKLFALLHLAKDTRGPLRANSLLLPNYEKPVIDIVLDFWTAGICLDLEARLAERRGWESDSKVDFGFWYHDDSTPDASLPPFPCHTPDCTFPFRATRVACFRFVREASRHNMSTTKFFWRDSTSSHHAWRDDPMGAMHYVPDDRIQPFVESLGMVVVCEGSDKLFLIHPLPEPYADRYFLCGPCPPFPWSSAAGKI